MAIRSGTCPSCGAYIEFTAGSSASCVCSYCRHLVVRSDLDLKTLGRVADVTYGDDSLAPGDRGRFRAHDFVVVGRLVIKHPLGGTWEEYHAIFDGASPGWISRAQGRWSVTQRVDASAPAFDEVEVGGSASLGEFGTFRVSEKSKGTFFSAEGELPFAAAPGTERAFVDLSGAGQSWATIDYGDQAEGTSTVVYVGVEATYAALNLQERGGPRPAESTPLADVTCPQCGAPIELRDKGAERVACAHCSAISEIATHKIVVGDQHARTTPKIALGSKGTLDGVEWTVIGFMRRSASIEGEYFAWSEYLLYAIHEEYRWLVEDEGQWWLGKSIPAGDVDDARFPESIRYDGRPFSLRNQQDAVVDFVVGEFYWKVTFGERTGVADFARGHDLVSREDNATEINWTFSKLVPSAEIRAQFGVTADAPVQYDGADDRAVRAGALSSALPMIGTVLFFIVFAVLWFTSESSGGSGGGHFSGGSGGGGFGGK